MAIWVVFEGYYWIDDDSHRVWDIYGVYKSKAKAEAVINSLKKRDEDYYNSLSAKKQEEYSGSEYRMEQHLVFDDDYVLEE